MSGEQGLDVSHGLLWDIKGFVHVGECKILTDEMTEDGGSERNRDEGVLRRRGDSTAQLPWTCLQENASDGIDGGRSDAAGWKRSKETKKGREEREERRPGPWRGKSRSVRSE